MVTVLAALVAQGLTIFLLNLVHFHTAGVVIVSALNVLMIAHLWAFPSNHLREGEDIWKAVTWSIIAGSVTIGLIGLIVWKWL